MTVNEILILTNFIINKEATGDVLIPTNYNVLLPETNITLFNEFWKQYEQLWNTRELQYVLADSPLGTFITQASISVNTTTGIGDLPTALIHLLGAVSIETGKRIDLITPMGAELRRTSALSVQADLSPFGYRFGQKLQIYPYDAGGTRAPSIDIVYLPIPTAPYYDYCQSAITYKRVFMPVGSYLTYMNPYWNLYQSNGTLIEASVTKTGASISLDPAYTSLTVELAWREDIHKLFISRMLGKVGIPLGEPAITQYAELLKKEGE